MLPPLQMSFKQMFPSQMGLSIPTWQVPEKKEKVNLWVKVYHDGSHPVAYTSKPNRVVCDWNEKRKRRKKTVLDVQFEKLYKIALSIDDKKSHQVDFIMDNLVFNCGMERENLSAHVATNVARMEKNAYLRKKRFLRKAFLLPWNYFVTFTYDDQKQTVESFKKRLMRVLSNFSTRYGWRYMIVQERSPEKERVHYHALMYIPVGAMRGQIVVTKEFSFKKHEMVTVHRNMFFYERFGRNDFSPIREGEIRRGTTMKYLLKYLEKSGERIHYSRGIPDMIEGTVAEDEIVSSFVLAADKTDFYLTHPEDVIVRYVLFDDARILANLGEVHRFKVKRKKE